MCLTIAIKMPGGYGMASNPKTLREVLGIEPVSQGTALCDSGCLCGLDLAATAVEAHMALKRQRVSGVDCMVMERLPCN